MCPTVPAFQEPALEERQRLRGDQVYLPGTPGGRCPGQSLQSPG